MLVEENQVPIIPARLRHRLVGVVEDRLAERQIIPFHARHFASLAADACSGIDEFADGEFSLRVFSWNTPGVSGYLLNA